jgi:hypothetical protein
VSLRQDAARAGAAVAMLIGISAWGAAPAAPDSPPLPAQRASISAPTIRVEGEPEREWIAQAPTQTPAPQLPATGPAATAQEPPAAPPVNEDEQQTLVLLADLQRYATAPADELRRELASVNQASNPRVRTDVNRIRLAVLLTIPNAGPPDDGRALALLESVAGKTGGASPVKQLALVLYLQIAERVRNVAEERKRTALAQEKLDQLRAVERSLLLERSRNAGGAGGGGGGGTGR